MNSLIFLNIIILGTISLIASVVLYFVSKKFKVTEDPRISQVEKLLPGANCGACGKAGCHDFATCCVKANASSFANLHCNVGGTKTMKEIGTILGFQATEKEPTVAVLRCQGTCEHAPEKIHYIGIKSCRLANKTFIGRTGCPTGCLRFGDCVSVCKFGALHIDEKTGIPVVDENKCTSCGACVNMCPRHLFEIRPKGKNGNRVYVACRNTQKGSLARKNCKSACIGCMKCTKINPEIKVENNLSYIPTTVSAEDFGIELAKNCPTGAIVCTKFSGEGK